jgi:hypothetical protein
MILRISGEQTAGRARFRECSAIIESKDFLYIDRFDIEIFTGSAFTIEKAACHPRRSDPLLSSINQMGMNIARMWF